MNIETQFNINDEVSFIDKYGNLKKKTIVGCRTQALFNGSKKVYYSFVKDGCVNYDFTGELPNKLDSSDFFWIPECCVKKITRKTTA